MRAALQPPIAMSMRRSKSGSKLEEEDLSYVRPSRGQQHTYGRSKRPHHHHHHSGGGGSSSCSGYGGAAENELNSECCSTNYERVGFNTSTGKYLHIWEMPLPIPGESWGTSVVYTLHHLPFYLRFALKFSVRFYCRIMLAVVEVCRTFLILKQMELGGIDDVNNVWVQISSEVTTNHSVPHAEEASAILLTRLWLCFCVVSALILLNSL